MSKNQRGNYPSDLEFSTFYLGDTLFGINLLDIQEINKHSDITRVPQAYDYIKGILNLRGKIVTMIDLGKKLGIETSHTVTDNRNIIVNSGGEYIGLMVDEISNIEIAKKEDIGPAPSNIGSVKRQYFQGVLKTGKELIGILNIDEVLKEDGKQDSFAA